MKLRKNCRQCHDEVGVKNYVLVDGYLEIVGVEKNDGISLCPYHAKQLKDHIRLSIIYLKIERRQT